MGGPLKQSKKCLSVAFSQHFDACGRLLVRLLRDLCLTLAPSSSSHRYTTVCMPFPVTIWSATAFQKQRCAGKQRLIRRGERAFHNSVGEMTHFCQNAMEVVFLGTDCDPKNTATMRSVSCLRV